MVIGMFSARTAPGVLLLALWTTTSHADEGMWTFNNFPADKVQKAYGFRPDQAWLDHVRLSSVRLTGASGCSADSFRRTSRTNRHSLPMHQDLHPKSDLASASFYANEERMKRGVPAWRSTSSSTSAM
jgi:hypothetical protein